MNLHHDNTYVTIDLNAIEKNIDAVVEKTGVPVMAVVKADAYGHGAVPVAKLLEHKCAFFGVSSIAEALELRNAGIQLPILVLGYTPHSAFREVIQQNIRVTIFHLEDAHALSEEATRQNKIARFHFKVETGMSRIGFPVCEAAADTCVEAARLPNLFAEGIFSHFATADCADLSRAKAQAERFDTFLSMLRNRGITIPICHLNNSAGLMNFSKGYEMVRSGIVTYGLYPSSEVDPELLPLSPALSWHSHITHLQTLPAGREIGYGGTYVTTGPTRVATIPVGYGDGYRWSLSNNFYVLIHGKKAPILGRICMDQMMVDVTHIPDVSIGNKVVLIGQDGDEHITTQQIAAAAGSFHYEFLCGISRRVPRYYVRDGQVVQTLHYLLFSQKGRL